MARELLSPATKQRTRDLGKLRHQRPHHAHKLTSDGPAAAESLKRLRRVLPRVPKRQMSTPATNVRRARRKQPHIEIGPNRRQGQVIDKHCPRNRGWRLEKHRLQLRR